MISDFSDYPKNEMKFAKNKYKNNTSFIQPSEHLRNIKYFQTFSLWFSV